MYCLCIFQISTITQNGLNWITSSCSEQCSCVSGTVVCSAYGCQQTETCGLDEAGLRQCQCRDGFIRNGSRCVGGNYQSDLVTDFAHVISVTLVHVNAFLN